MKTMPSRNREWGFFGTMRDNRGLDETEAGAWFEAVEAALVERFPALDASAARDLLDSTIGRHLADALEAETRVGLSLPRWTGREVRRFLRTYDAERFTPNAE